MREVRGVFVFFAFLATVVTGCDRGLGPDTAAIAADFRLGVEDAAQILAPVSALPNDGGVVETTLDYWIDYTLLAWVVNQEGALEELDISSIVDQEVERVIVVRLRDQVIQLDTAITDEELQATFEERRPGEEVRARHILLSITPSAAQAERDSVRALAEDIRDRARAGEDFATLAEEYSQDPGSAIQGGDLGFFGRGMMVPPFEEAAFALPPGEVSDVVQSGFGFHVILLEERRTPSFEDIADAYRIELQTERTMVAESTYLAELEGPANVLLGDDAIELVRRITAAPEDRLSRSEASSPLTIWEGGELPAEEYRDFVVGQPREIRQQIVVAGDQQLESMLRDLTRDKLLLGEALRMGVESTDEDEETIISDLVNQYVLIADFLGLDSLQVEEGTTLTESVDRAVRDLMSRLVANEQDIVPLGPLALPLRALYGQRVSEAAVERIVARVDELRVEGAAQPILTEPSVVAPAPPSVEPPLDGEPEPGL